MSGLSKSGIVSKGKKSRSTTKKKLDTLFSLKVRSKGFCERCGTKDNLQCAHIISRRYHQVRWDLNNALSLCRGCHMYFTYHPIEWEDYIIKEKGNGFYQNLREKALNYGKIDYEEVLENIK